MFAEEDLLPISALQHLAFCERQWGLMYLEGLWAENALTVEGHYLHERVDTDSTEVRGDIRIARGLRLRSLRLGLTGRADVVEFHRVRAGAAKGIPLEGVDGLWRPVPIEYKRGRPKPDERDEVQLCAQALCLEEMLGALVAAAMLFYGVPRRRYDVVLDAALRQRTEALCVRLHHLTQQARTPAARYDGRCKSCSLSDCCMPKVCQGPKDVKRYLESMFEDVP